MESLWLKNLGKYFGILFLGDKLMTESPDRRHYWLLLFFIVRRLNNWWINKIVKIKVCLFYLSKLYFEIHWEHNKIIKSYSPILKFGRDNCGMEKYWYNYLSEVISNMQFEKGNIWSFFVRNLSAKCVSINFSHNIQQLLKRVL